uniref:Splicing factor n=1 Tax=Tanacetum cinerariifolium TaxID=118510 RepID=A0A6L2KVX2_TANCI|nr:splicing factor [Tanacetum cinerariifolium]
MGSGIRAMGTDSSGRGRRIDGRETMGSTRVRRGGARGRRGGGRRGRRGGGRGSTSRLKAFSQSGVLNNTLIYLKTMGASRRKEPNVQYALAKCKGRGFKYEDRGAMGAKSSGRGQMGAKSGGRVVAKEEEVMAGKLWVVQELKEVVQEEEDVVADEEEEVVEEDPLLMDGDDIKKSMEDEHMQGLLVEQEDLRQKQEKEHQDKLDEEALQQAGRKT